ncbi:serine/threonine-protein kinase [Streptomyces sp. NPDC014802]|uniref:serine/threonine-protein kinase n=1 Tax=Streptomyces sp. NPDC014802 TaxID=3364917 RepID=UPI0036FB3ADF
MNNEGAVGDGRDRLVGGRYRLVERIGSGGMGTVWRAHDRKVDRDVAVKQPRLPGDPEDESHRRAAHRLYREARAAARVDHPSAVTIHDVVVEDGLPWIVMELVRGESLDAVLRKGPLPPAEAARIGAAVLGALRAAHAVGIVHRDVKPANVLLGPPPLSDALEPGHPHGRVVLTDFGIAHVQGEESLTGTGEFVGSLEFVAPERMSGRGAAGPASDLWSLGVLLYAAVEGWSPFRRTTVESTLAAILTADVPEPQRAGPLAPLLIRLLERDPERRPGPEETARALAEAAGGETPDRGSASAGGGGAEPKPESEPLPESKSLPEPVPLQKTQEAQEAEEAEESGAPPGSEEHAPPSPSPEHAPSSPSPSSTEHVPSSPSTGRPSRRPLLLGALAVLVAGGVWFGVSAFLDRGSGAGATEFHGTYRPAPAASTGSTWVAHEEPELDAVLVLPDGYRRTARQSGGGDRPRLVVYGAGGAVQARLAEWDKAPGAPMERAREAERTWRAQHADARTQLTRTGLHGDEAVCADTAFRLGGERARVLQLFVRTGDGRLYELRVDMPKGTAQEHEGTQLFKGARDRLRLSAGPQKSRSAAPTP